MKRTYLIYAMLCSSCGLTPDLALSGEYLKNGRDYQYKLTINKDSTFVLSKRYRDASPSCEGKWSYFSKDTAALDCDPVLTLISR